MCSREDDSTPQGRSRCYVATSQSVLRRVALRVAVSRVSSSAFGNICVLRSVQLVGWHCSLRSVACTNQAVIDQVPSARKL